MTATKPSIPLDRVGDFCRKWKITEFALFGSVLRDDFRPDSDIDILVSFAPDAVWDYWVGWPEMIDELEAMFERKVDLVSKTSLKNPFRRHEILKTRQVIYAA
jgi:predicted nucleotidyltransferase